MPEAEFLSPNAPFPCELSPFGFQWFGLEDRSPEMKLGGVRVAAQILEPFLDAELARRGLGDRDLALVGFSQGTMMSLHVGPRRANPIGGILGFSGALIAPELLAQETRSKPPVFLVHGTADQVVPFGALAQAESALRDAGIPVETEFAPGPGPFDRPGRRAKRRPVPAPVLRERPRRHNDKQMKSTGWRISTSCGFRPAPLLVLCGYRV